MATPTDSIILVKSRTYFPSKTNVMTMFYFKDPIVFFNVFFQNLFMNRVNEDTSMAFINSRQHEYILNAWSSSPLSDNTLFDSKLPFPNTRNYVWTDMSINTKIKEMRDKFNAQKKVGRPYLDTPLKTGIKNCLLHVNHYTIEITKNTLDDVMVSSRIAFSYRFNLPKQIRSSKINETNYSNHRLHMNIIESIKIFAENFVEIEPSDILPKPTMSVQQTNVTTIEENSDEDEEYRVNSRHPSYIEDDGSMADTTPIRRPKRRRVPDVSPRISNLLHTPPKTLVFEETPPGGLKTPLLTTPFMERSSSLFSPSFFPQHNLTLY